MRGTHNSHIFPPDYHRDLFLLALQEYVVAAEWAAQATTLNRVKHLVVSYFNYWPFTLALALIVAYCVKLLVVIVVAVVAVADPENGVPYYSVRH